MAFSTQSVATAGEVTAPDGSMVRLLAVAGRGSMAHFTLPPHGVARAVRHRTVDELWFVLSGRGRMWRCDADTEEVVVLEYGVSLAIPCGASFQFRSDSAEPLHAVGVTMPPWPGDDEAYFVEGPWDATV
jgi:mannose-6-phosphate isomerase-like protein (cupin superfamily)